MGKRLDIRSGGPYTGHQDEWKSGECRPVEEHQFMDISKLLHCGVYALLRRGEVVYVGKSTKPLIRIYSHLRNRGKEMKRTINPEAGPTANGRGIMFDGLWFLPCMLGQMDTLEGYFIRKYIPKYNVRGKPLIAIPDEIKELLKQVVVIANLPQVQNEPTAPQRAYITRRL